MPRKPILILTLLCLFSGLVLLIVLAVRPTPPPVISPKPLTVEQVQSLGTLVTARVVVRGDFSEHVSGYLGGLTVRWRGNGSVLLGPDLRRTRVIDQDDVDGAATVVLPPPEVLERTLDLTNGGFDADWNGLWQAAPDGRLLTSVQDRVLAAAQSRLGDAVTADHQCFAMRSAEAAIGDLGRSLGRTLRVEWAPPDGHLP